MSDDRPISRAAASILRDTADELFMSQSDLSRRSGVAQPQISAAFRDRGYFTLDQIDALCDALGLSLLAVIDEAKRRVDER